MDCFVKSLTLYHTTNFEYDYIESICRQQNKCWLNGDFSLSYSRKHCGKRRKSWLPALSHFPGVFSKAVFFRVNKSRYCVVKS